MKNNIYNTSLNTVAILDNQKTNSISTLPVFDSRFSQINMGGHSTTLPPTLADVNDTGHTYWEIPATAQTLSVVSTSADDTVAGGTGIQILQLNGLDQNLDEISEFILMDGITPVLSSLTYRSMHLSTAIACGTVDIGAVGRIDITSAAPSIIWASYLIGDSSSQTGRIVVPRDHRYYISGLIFNGGVGGDMTMRSDITIPGVCNFTLGETYVGDNVTPVGGLSTTFFEAGWMFKFRGFTNSGSPATRKISTNIFFIDATVDDWESLKITQ